MHVQNAQRSLIINREICRGAPRHVIEEGFSVLNRVSARRISPVIVGCLAATWLIWGSTYLAIKFALASFPPFFQMGSRFVLAGSVLLLWVGRRTQRMPTPVEWRNAGIIGTLMLGGMGCVAYAEQSVASGLIVVFIAIVPMLTVLANLFFGLKPSRVEVLGIAIGLAGVSLLARSRGFASSAEGLLAMIVSTLSWSIGSVLSLHRFPLAKGAAGFASEMVCGGGVLLLISWWMGERFHWPPAPLASVAWLYLVVFGSLIAFTAYMTLLSRVSVALATSYTLVNPVIALILGVGVGGETVTDQEWLAAGIVVLGVVTLIIGKQRRHAPNSRRANNEPKSRRPSATT
jgi:drug/metabolite transporter (DMT)-like permease